MPKILITQAVPSAMLTQLKTLVDGKAEIEAVTTPQDDEFGRLAAEADVIINGFRQLDATALTLAPKVRFIQQLGVGYNNLDTKTLAQAGIIASNTPGVNSQAVAEHTILLMMVLLKRFVMAENATRANTWPQLKIMQAGIGEIGTSTIGLIGFGSIGQAIAKRLKPFGSRLLYTSRQRADPALEEKLGVRYLNLPELLATASIVTLQLPLNAQTRHMIGAPELNQMKPGSILINTSRGEIVDEAALRQAIESGHLAGAGLDVLTNEADGGNPFYDLPQVVVTPHMGGISQGAVARTVQMAFENVVRYLNGEKPLYILPELQNDNNGFSA